MHSNGEHIPVLLTEALDGLAVKPGKLYVDATFGRGGHTQAIVKNGGKVIAFDHDADAIEYGKHAMRKEIDDGVLMLKHTNFAEMDTIAELKDRDIAGVLFDFGISSAQLDDPSRGLSFQDDAPLDMRMDRRLGVTAADLINALGKRELADLLMMQAQESNAKIIADAIVRQRAQKPITTTTQLAEIVEQAVGGRARGPAGHLHPATKTFMALRMAVNTELFNIERALPTALDVLSDGGRMVTISFHEGEDRIVKHTMRLWQEQGKGRQLTDKPVTPSIDELRANPRSRSGKLRIFVKGNQ